MKVLSLSSASSHGVALSAPSDSPTANGRFWTELISERSSSEQENIFRLDAYAITMALVD